MAFIAVLGGAGFHSPDLEGKYKNLLKDACKTGLIGSSALNCVESAISKLEDSVLTNAGYGSSLTRVGTVELDAVIQDGKSGYFGAVGCVDSIRNPIKAASQLLKAQLEPPSCEHAAGLVQPSFLAGPGVLEWLKQRSDIEICQPDDLIAPERREEFSEYQKIVSKSFEKQPPQDTVGSICIFPQDGRYSISCGSSSGGSVMKFPGRIGPAGVIGASCWCEQSSDSGRLCGVIVSGEGEFILSKLVARTLACHLVNSQSIGNLPVINVAIEAFNKMHLFDGGYQLGLIIVYAHVGEGDTVKTVDVVWAHSSPSLAVGFSQSGSSAPLVKISRFKTVNAGSHHQLVEGRTFLLSTSLSNN